MLKTAACLAAALLFGAGCALGSGETGPRSTVVEVSRPAEDAGAAAAAPVAVVFTENAEGEASGKDAGETPAGQTASAGSKNAEGQETGQDLSGISVDPRAKTLDLDAAGIRVTDREALARVLDGAPNLEEVLLFDSPLSTGDQEWLFDRYYPRIFFGFTVRIGPHTIRTDQTAFSTLHHSAPTKEDPRHTSAELYPLRMCTRMKALDVGHNVLTDLNFLYFMPEIEVLIISPNYGLEDISPVAACRNLVYLECFHTPVTDLSPLAGLTKLRDLNLTRDGMVEDISPLYDLPALERFWWGSMGRVPAEQKKAMRRAHPGCKFVSVYDPTDGGWRNHSHYRELHAFFRSGEYVPFSK